MTYTYIFEAGAQMEYEEAVIWYIEKSDVAGRNFELELNGKLLEICQNPTLYRNTKKKFREALLKKYPFSIVYFIDQENRTIVITSVFHTSRNPKRKFIRKLK